MKATHIFAGLFILLFLFVVSGCAPAILGDATRQGKGPSLLMGERGTLLRSLKYEFVTKGAELDVTMTMSSGTVCKSNYRLNRVVKSYPILSFIPGLSGTAYHVYRGSFDANMPGECQKITGGPGGAKTELTIGPVSFGSRDVTVCPKEEWSDLTCIANIHFVVPPVEGIDD